MPARSRRPRSRPISRSATGLTRRDVTTSSVTRISPPSRPYLTALSRRLMRTTRISAGSQQTTGFGSPGVATTSRMPRASRCECTSSIASSSTSLRTWTFGCRRASSSPPSTRARSRYSRTRSSRYSPLRMSRSSLSFCRGGISPEVAVGEQARVGHHRGHRALELVAHEPEHLRVGVVGLLELLDAPRLLDGLAQALGDRHLQLDVLGVVGVGDARAAEDEADDAALDAQGAGEVGAHALGDEEASREASRVLLEVGFEVADDARQPGLEHGAQ